MKEYKAQILSNIKVADGYYVLCFKAGKAQVNAAPGQFFNIKVNEGGSPLLRRPFGLHSVSDGGVKILYKIVGNATEMLAGKAPGEYINVLGPLGKGFDLNNAGTKNAVHILAGGGHGIAPLLALAENLRKKRKNVIVLIGGRTKCHIVGEIMFKRIGCRVFVSSDDGSAGYKGRVSGLLDDILAKNENKTKKTAYFIYACGPKPMLRTIAGLGMIYGVPTQVSLEEYLGCGIGICVGCPVETKAGRKLVCKDGPVFEAGDIIWKK